MPANHSDAPDAFQTLRDRRVQALVLGRAVSNLGAQFITVAVGWELYERTNDPLALGLTGLFSALPVFALMVPAGNAADRYPRRNIAMLGYGLLALASLGLTLVSWLQAPIWIMYGLLVAIGSARAFASPSIDSMLPQ